MTEDEKNLKLNDARELLSILEEPGGKLLLKLIDDTIKEIPCDVVDFVGVSPSTGMSVDTNRIAFSAGGKTYLKEVLRRIDEIKEFVKKVAEEKEKVA